MAHRFAVGVRDNNPSADLHVFSDTENNFIQVETLKYLYPDFYSSFTVIPSKKYKKCIIDSQFGEEEYRGGIHNVPNEIKTKIEQDCDKFYNLHIDSLSFTDFDFDWTEYFYKIPEPEINPVNCIGHYICSQLVSGSSLVHRMESWYLERIIKELDLLCQKLNVKHIIISQPEINDIYSAVLKETKNTTILNGSISDVCDMVLNSIAFIGVDSAWRLLGYSKNIPTLTFSKDCRGYAGVNPSHKLRWLIHPQWTFGLHHSTGDILNLFEKMINDKIYMLFPELAFTNQKIDDIIIRRDYKVNLEKSILNP